MKNLTLLFCTILPLILSAQSIKGTWQYEVQDTPSGDYTGDLIIHQDQTDYKAEIISSGDRASVEFLYASENAFSATATVAGWSATITGKLILDQIEGQVTVPGDINPYIFTAVRKKIDPVIKLIDANTLEPIPYASILHEAVGIISNEDGYFSIKNSRPNSALIISAIGYKTDTILVNDVQTNQSIGLAPISYSLPTIEIEAKGFSAKKIVETAIKRIDQNYIQAEISSDLFYRNSIYNEYDSLTYQSESLLKFYDSYGYSKSGWRKSARKRHVRLEEGRITTVDEQPESLQLGELRVIFTSWSNSPLLSKDGPFSIIGLEGFDYDLIEIGHLDGAQVYVIEYRCTNLKEKYSGHPSMTSSQGKMYINKSDFALLRIESEAIIDWTWKGGKAIKKRGNKIERSILKINGVELFAKSETGYYSSYSDKVTKRESIITRLNGDEHSDTFSQRQQFQHMNLNLNNVERLDNNLFNINIENQYNQTFWDQFNFILKD